MIALDLSQLAPEVARLLMLRGMEVPPLQWGQHANRGAKKILDGMDDARLLAREQLADEEMASAVRALLYLWNGLAGDCGMYAQAAPQRERLYLAGLCERHTGHSEAAKGFFKEIGGHPIHEALSAYALDIMRSANDPGLERFKEMLTQTQSWEPFLFADNYEQARLGKCSSVAQQVICSLQCREFELLLAHCYQQATGVQLTDRPATQDPAKRPKRQTDTQRLRRSTRHSAAVASEPAPTKKAGPANSQKQEPDKQLVRIRCPRCEQIMTAPESARGRQHECLHCGAMVLVPHKKGASALPSAGGHSGSSARSQQVSLLCPRCNTPTTVPESARGQKTQCRKCGAVFVVPRRQPAGTA